MSTKNTATEGESYGAFVRRQFRKSTFGVISLWIVGVIAVIAILADVLANDKPIVCSIKNETRFPVFVEYGVTMGITTWGADFATADWKTLPYDWAVWPPVPFAPNSTDK